jgi:hypothetical protein
MKRLFVPVALTSMLSACAVQPIPLDNRAAESYQVPYQKMIVDNLSTESKIGVNDVIYVNGWAPAHSGFKPPLNESFVSKIKNSIVANGESGRVDVSVLRVGFFVEKNVADDIVFIGLFMLGRERGFKCDADVNVKTERDSQRMTLTHEIRRSHFDNQEQIRQFIETCQTDLISQLADSIKKAI